MSVLCLPSVEPGTVWLVGAGPGDPGLLTALAIRSIETADVIVYDALVNPEILSLARPGTRLEPLGKRAGQPSPTQDTINRRLVALALDGLAVVRLKGGDPFVFGRGGEEALALASAGIAFRIVPGVSAGTGGLAAAGIPVTHRGVTSSVTFLTGVLAGEDGQAARDTDWAVLARLPALVLFMALGRVEEIARRLIEHGMAPATPLAIVSNATLASQTVIETNLAGVGGEVSRLAPQAPAIIAIGGIVDIGAAIRPWMSAAPPTFTSSARAGLLCPSDADT